MDSVLGAEVEAAAGEDDIAERTFDAVARRTAPSRRSYVLSRAVATFTDSARDDSAVFRRLPIAERYLQQMLALSPPRYATVFDSLALVDRAYEGAVTVLTVSSRVGDAVRAMAHLKQTFAVLRRTAGFERVDRFESAFPYEALATVLLAHPGGRARLDSIAAQVLTLVALTPSELATLPPERRATARRDVAQEALNRIRLAALLERAAPPLMAHAWLGTSDSIYSPVPRSRTFDDGTIRLLYFPVSWRDGGRATFPVASRIHREISRWGEVVVALATEGSIGTEPVEAADEMAWLRTFLPHEAHLTTVVALWAGAEQSAPYGGRLPEPAPIDRAYRDVVRRFPAIVVDGHGIVRGFFRLGSHRDEEVLTHALRYLHAEAGGTASTSDRPASLVPAVQR
jgi:hypothetical protein